MNYHTCQLCGVTGPQVRMRLAQWADPDTYGKEYQPIAACTDVRECRERVEQLGESWPLREVKELAR